MSKEVFQLEYDHDAISKLYRDQQLPEFAHYVSQPRHLPVADMPGQLLAGLDREFGGQSLKNLSIALAVGSRGIDQIARVTRTLVDYFLSRKAKPFIVAAMGSHGGAVSEGQRGVLAEYGITEETMGVAIKTCMDVTDISTPGDLFPIYIASDALAADRIFVVNRVKPHTDFFGKHESGMMKMIAIGLGKHQGALACHAQGFLAMPENIETIARKLIATGKVLGGVGIVENAAHQICRIEAVDADHLPEKDTELLEFARTTFGTLPIKELDVLMVGFCGKEISGSGLDPLVTGRFWIESRRQMKVGIVVCSDLTDHSAGNAVGLGTADMICARLAHKIDLTKVYINGLTSRGLIGIKIPLIVSSDEDAMKLCMLLCDKPADQVRMACIRDTNATGSFFVSSALIPEMDALHHLTRQNDPLILKEGYIRY